MGKACPGGHSKDGEAHATRWTQVRFHKEIPFEGRILPSKGHLAMSGAIIFKILVVKTVGCYWYLVSGDVVFVLF